MDEDTRESDEVPKPTSFRTRVLEWLHLRRATSKASTAPSHDTHATRRLKGWSWEFASFAVAIGCFVGAVAMLTSVKDKAVPSWASKFSVNATLSVLVTIMKGAIGIVVAECLSQLKWTWFKRERKLKDLGVLDDASRGVWGAATLLRTKRPWFLAYIGAFIFLASFIIGPTIQLTTEIRVREINVTQAASVPICNTTYLDLVGLGSAPGTQRATLPAIGAIYNGILQSDPNKMVVPSCSSGNCTFPTYQSLGICNQCTDLSSRMSYSLSTQLSGAPPANQSISFTDCQRYYTACVVELPGYGIKLVESGLMNSTVSTATQDDANAPSYTFEPPVGIFRAILRQNAPTTQAGQAPLGFTAVECALRFCVNTYESSVRLGNYEERLVSSTWAGSKTNDDSPFNFQNNVTIKAEPCYVDGEKIGSTEHQDQCTYHASGGSALALANTFSGLLSGYAYLMAGGRVSWLDDVMTAIWGLFDTEDLHNSESGTLKTVDKAMVSLANSITTYGRSAACGGATIAGIMKWDEIYIHVDWAWLIPITIELSLCLVFFVATIIHSRHDSLWKSAVYAYLFCKPQVHGKKLVPDDMIELVDNGPAKIVRGDVTGMVKDCEQVEVVFVSGMRKRERRSTADTIHP